MKEIRECDVWKEDYYGGETEQLSKAVVDFIRPIGLKYGLRPIEGGPGHIFFEDQNQEDEHIDFCIKECDRVEYWTGERELDPEALVEIREALVKIRGMDEFHRLSAYGWYLAYQTESGR